MYKDNQLYVAHSSEEPIHIIGKMANRHGLIAGATGTGKTVTLQVLAETFSQAGVPCFMADMKGDLSGISQKGGLSKFIEKRCAEWGMDTTTLKFEGCPVRFFDVYGEQGHPMRTTIEKMGAMLGDFVEVGCNSVLNPGTVIGSHSNVYPLSPVRGFVPANSIYKARGCIVTKK